MLYLLQHLIHTTEMSISACKTAFFKSCCMMTLHGSPELIKHSWISILMLRGSLVVAVFCTKYRSMVRFICQRKFQWLHLFSDSSKGHLPVTCKIHCRHLCNSTFHYKKWISQSAQEYASRGFLFLKKWLITCQNKITESNKLIAAAPLSSSLLLYGFSFPEDVRVHMFFPLVVLATKAVKFNL